MKKTLEDNIIKVMQSAKEPLRLNQIAQRSGETERSVKSCILEHIALGNISTTIHTNGHNDNLYEWISVLAVSDELEQAAKEPFNKTEAYIKHETPAPQEAKMPLGKQLAEKGLAFMAAIDGYINLRTTKRKIDDSPTVLGFHNRRNQP